MGNELFTNPSAQQGESQTRKGARGPANSNETLAGHPKHPDDVDNLDVTDEPLGTGHVGKPGKSIPVEDIVNKPLRKQ